MNAEETAPTNETTVAPPTKPLGRYKLLARLALAGGAIAVLAGLFPAWPREHAIELRLEDAPSIVGIDVAWSRSGDDPVRGGSWSFAPGTAPRSIETSVSFPNGNYDLDVTLRRTERADTLHRSIVLGDASRITVPLR